MILEFLRVVFISGETLWLLTCSLSFWLLPNFVGILGNSMRTEEDVLQYATGLVLALCGYAAYLTWKVIAPRDDSNSDLYEWPDYWRLKLRVFVSLAFSVMAFACIFFGWIFKQHFSDGVLGFLVAISIGVALIDVGCLLFAAFVLKEITDEKKSG